MKDKEKKAQKTGQAATCRKTGGHRVVSIVLVYQRERISWRMNSR